MNTQVKERDNVTSKEFMLEEYRLLEDRYNIVKNEVFGRFNLFTTLTPVLVIALFSLRDFLNMFPTLFNLMFLGILFFLAMFGWDVFENIIISNLKLDEIERGLGRIRRYFVEIDPILTEFLTYRYHDGPTSYVNINHKARGWRRITKIVFSSIIFLGVLFISTLLNVDICYCILLGLIGFFISDKVLEMRANSSLVKAKKKVDNEVRFPMNLHVLDKIL